MSEPALDPSPWEIPEGVRVAPGVDLDAPDPALVLEPWLTGKQAGARRRCVAAKLDGSRCGGMASPDGLLCAIHDGRADPSQAALARGAAARERGERAEAVLQLQRLGTRAVVARALVEKAAEVDRAVRLLCDAAGAGDLASAKALLPWIDQALGRPTERTEITHPSTPSEVESLDDQALRALVAEGRAARLRAVEDEPDGPRTAASES